MSRYKKSPPFIRFMKWMGFFAGVGVFVTYHWTIHGPEVYRKKDFREIRETHDLIFRHGSNFFGEKYDPMDPFQGPEHK